MEFNDVVTSRRMTRRFLRDPLPADTVGRIVRNATRGPSAGNSKGFAFLVLESQDDRDRFWRALAPTMPVVETVRDAPLVVVPMSS